MYPIFISAAGLPRLLLEMAGISFCSRHACETRSRGPATKTCLSLLCCFTRCLVVKNGNKKGNLRVSFWLKVSFWVTNDLLTHCNKDMRIWILETERYGYGKPKTVEMNLKVSAENGKQMV